MKKNLGVAQSSITISLVLLFINARHMNEWENKKYMKCYHSHAKIALKSIKTAIQKYFTIALRHLLCLRMNAINWFGYTWTNELARK